MEAAYVIRRNSYALVTRRSREVEKKEIVNQRLPVRDVSPAAPTANLRLCADEIGSFVRHKKRQRWCWWVADAASAGGRLRLRPLDTRHVSSLAGPVGKRRLSRRRSLPMLGARTGTCLLAAQHQIGKVLMQRLERKQQTLCMRLKQLTRRKICFSKKQFFHDGLMASFIFHCFP